MNRSYPVKFIFILLFFIELNSLDFGQTSAWGNYELYSRKTSQSTLGYLSTNLMLPENVGTYEFAQKGIMYTNEYNIANLGTILMNSNNEINFSLCGAFRIGAATGTGSNDSSIITNSGSGNLISNSGSTNLTYYSATLDIFSMDIAIDYTFIFDNGDAIVPKFQFGLIDIGATVNILKQGVFNQSGIGVVSLIPFSIRPSIYIDFGRSSLGFAFFINPYNFLDYRVVPAGLFDDGNSGIKFRDRTEQRDALQIMFSF